MTTSADSKRQGMIERRIEIKGRDWMAKKRIVIVGGGTAGWITANALIRSWGDDGLDITLIESPEIGTVGVGEGSTPRLKNFFDSLGVHESEWMSRCNATYKNGISFVNWSRVPGYHRYYHPFPSRTDEHTLGAFFVNTIERRRGVDVHAHPDRFFLSARLAEQRLGPIPNENFPFAVEYGYHFDAHLVGEFLKEKAITRGVTHIQGRVMEVKQASDGNIAGLLTDADETISGDFFVDCSGFRGLLLQETLQVPYQSFSANLFNDAAVVLPTPQVESISSQTVSTAMKHGWAWEIPLTHRIGNGYVYSSNFCSSDEAETELRGVLGLLDSGTEARHLKMKVGRVEEHWHKNCLAVGLSQGFIEPLEATALNLVCSTVDDFITAVDAEGIDGAGRVKFNESVNEKFEQIRDYIVAHYRLNSRDDTEYWRQNRANDNLADTLKRIMRCWERHEDLAREFDKQQIRSAYGPMSWACILAGHGVYPGIEQRTEEKQIQGKVDMTEIDDFVRRCAMNFRTQNELLGIK